MPSQKLPFFRKLSSQTGFFHIVPLLVLALLIGGIFVATNQARKRQNVVSRAQITTAATFFESFTGAPATPARFNNDSSLAANWNVVANQSDSYLGDSENGDFHNPNAHHGQDCSPPLDAQQRLVVHNVPHIQDAVYQCKDHIMTSLLAGYALAYLTPNHMVDLSQGDAKIRFDMTTYSTSGRDWVDVWIMPMAENFVVPLEEWLPTYNGPPKNAVHVRTDGNSEAAPGNSSAFHWEGTIYRNFNEEGMNGSGNFFGGINTALQNSGAKNPDGTPVTVSPQRRDTFELTVSKTRAKMCLVSVNVVPAVPTNQCWFDASFGDLGWSSGVVMFGHHAYNNQKDCSPSGLGGNYINISCLANTWHWDQVSIAPSIPFTIVKPTASSPKFVTLTNNRVDLIAPAPANSFVRFAAVGTNIEASFNDGPWTSIPRRQQVKDKPEHFSNYWASVPTGTTNIKFRGSAAASWLNKFNVQHVAVYSSTAGPTPTPCTVNCPTPTPTATPTPSPTPLPSGSQTITFNDRGAGSLTGEYPANTVTWSSVWQVSAPFGGFTTNNISYNGAGPTSGTFSFVSPRRLSSIDATNGGSSTTTVSLACAGNTTKQQTLAPGQTMTISTGFTNTCTTVTIGSTNGWDTNFDNLVHDGLTGVPTPSPTVPPTPTPVPTPTKTPTPTPTATPIPTATPCTKLGDLNGDCLITVADLSIFLSDFTTHNLRSDLNNDGTVTVADLSLFLSKFGQ